MTDLNNHMRQQHLVPFYTSEPGQDNSYTLLIDPKTKGIVKADAKNVSAPFVTFIIMLGYPMVQFFPIHIIPMHNMIAFIGICSFVMLVSILFGYYLSPRMLKNYRPITLLTDEWAEHLQRVTTFYVRQLSFIVVLLLISFACFVLLYVYPTNWWLFGGIISGIVAGAGITSLSKTKYLLYKNKLDVHLN